MKQTTDIMKDTIISEEQSCSTASHIKTQECICKRCGTRFIVRECELEGYGGNRVQPPDSCPSCRTALRKQREEKKKEADSAKRRTEAEKAHKLFLERLRDWTVVPKEAVRPDSDNVLYIIGNGFDMMHHVPSSYYSFRDSLGKHCNLRETLETYITDSDLWADFESSLAHLNIEAMSNGYVIDMWLDIFDAYNEETSAADYYAALDAAATPIVTITDELPRRFRLWVDSLKVGTDDRPLKEIIRNGKVLCFNYTEFIEEWYGVEKQNVCYIHGCRRREKGHPPEKLILGHKPGASDSAFDFEDDLRKVTKDRGKQAFIAMAQDNVLRSISDYDEELTKSSTDILAAHEPFFSALENVDTVIAIGHSFSEVDWDYFEKIRASITPVSDVKWYFGCYGLRDLENLEKLIKKLGIRKSDAMVFRTDDIVTKPIEVKASDTARPKVPKERRQCASEDGKWLVKTVGNSLMIEDLENHTKNYETSFSYGITRAFFAPDDDCLFAVVYGVEPGVFLFRNESGQWRFVSELACDHQHLLVNRLNRVLVTEKDVSFVYNNRIRKYSLVDGKLLSNRQVRGAKTMQLKGENITKLFERR